MNGFVLPVAIAASIATLLMIVGMLYLVWISMGDDTHAPGLDSGDDEETELEGGTA